MICSSRQLATNNHEFEGSCPCHHFETHKDDYNYGFILECFEIQVFLIFHPLEYYSCLLDLISLIKEILSLDRFDCSFDYFLTNLYFQEF